MYCFLIASLPELQLDAPPPMSVEAFLEICKTELSEEKFAELTSFDGSVTPDFKCCDTFPAIYNAYGKFELYLRYRIAMRRAEKANEQLELPEPSESFSDYDYAAATLANTANPAERELIIDRLRWNFIEEQLLCKEFTLDALCAYKLKLAIVNKYRHRKLEPGQKNFDAALERLSQKTVRQE
jgi:hypothetical protein